MAGRGTTALGAALNAAFGAAFLAGLAWAGPAAAAGPHDRRAHAPGHHHARRHAPAHAARVQTGEASVYSSRLSGRKMADGTRFDPRSNAVANKTLPLGTTARVTNLENGRTTTVEVRDRGPYARGRILDVSPGSARRLGMDDEGKAPVSVVPLAVPKRE